jgi:PPM family protein phosphatase
VLGLVAGLLGLVAGVLGLVAGLLDLVAGASSRLWCAGRGGRHEEGIVELLTIGAFARAARLSPKALRMYHELGLLSPVAVDAESGYRYYDPAQLDRARLVAMLRRIGMPLARIRGVVDLPGTAAAKAIEAYWAEVEADTAARGELATFLVDVLSGGGKIMSTLALRYAARTDAGRGRDTNEDAAYAGARLLAVADGLRGHAGVGEAAIAALAVREGFDLGDLSALAGEADRAVAAFEGDAITTLTALLWDGSRIGVLHIGDTRAYLLRNGVLARFTQDHSYVQKLVDEGSLGADEARGHPQRALLVRALGSDGEADLSLRTAIPGDRYLLCSDGLWSVVDDDALRAALAAGEDPETTVQRLVDLAYEAGAPDNIAVVVADAV